MGIVAEEDHDEFELADPVESTAAAQEREEYESCGLAGMAAYC